MKLSSIHHKSIPELCNPPLNESLATPDKPQVCRPSGFNSSLRLEENKVSADNGRDLSSLSRKTNEDGKEDASPQWYNFALI